MRPVSWNQIVVVASCLINITLQVTMKQQEDGVPTHQKFQRSLGIAEEQFTGNVNLFPQPLDVFKELLMTAKPKEGELFSAEKPMDFNVTLNNSSPLIAYDTPQIIEYYGYPVETHHVTSEDGYRLEIHRIPFGKNGSQPGVIREPIILQHGILCSSADWVMNPPDQGFAYLLADAGYDVWLPNARGNTYSKTNSRLSNEDKEFWMFSWNEIGDYDMPAIIDYILLHTGFSQVYYSGHSMGTTMFFVMMDKHPEYNKKVRAFFAMAPVATVDNMKSPVKVLLPLLNVLETMVPIYVSHTPAGASTKTVVHYAQIAKSTIFRQYDHGEDNIDWYGNTAPPLYDLSKTTIDTYFYWGENDWLAAPEDVLKTASYLPNLKLIHRVNDDKWTHLDFMWGIQANTLLYENIIKEMSSMHIDLSDNGLNSNITENIGDGKVV